MNFFQKYWRSIIFIFQIFGMISCKEDNSLFTSIPSEFSGIHFNNRIIETDSINVLDFENVYNGGGVGIGDFNNDGLQDIYFTGNLVSNKLYLNKGGFRFKDITNEAKVDGRGKWCRGTAVVDINNDGRLDLYVCATLKKDAKQRENLLYINQGSNKDGIPYFVESAQEYGLDDTSQCTQAAFFDYDNDNDLDVYIVNNEIQKDDYPNRFRPILKDGKHPNTDRLYRNDWDSSVGHPVFTNVSKEAGIQTEGYGHAVSITDINKDGWKDIYVTNDYLSNDLLWINQHDGSFKDALSTYFKHTSANAMGNDVTDINNDGLMDIVVLDMDPEDAYRKKMMLNANSYQTYQNSDYFGYNYQYVRNTLQLNQGFTLKQNDTIAEPIFSDVSFYSGIAETDWSWTPLVADFDNDGFRDIIVTNGFPKDITDHDFIAFRNISYSIATKKQLLEQIPEVKLHNYAFKNNNGIKFSDVSSTWGMDTPSFSNGAVYVDLDNDGDLDIVVNNINDEALIYKNNKRNEKKRDNHFLKIRFEGDSLNINGIGTWAELYYDHGKKQVWENSPYRGYLSTIENSAHFGLGKTEKLDSVIIKWPAGKMQVLLNVKVDQVLKVNIKNATKDYIVHHSLLAENTLFKEITSSLNIHYLHEERDFIDFNIQKLLPHKLSEYGPPMAVGDVDGNGLEDLVVGGSFSYSLQLLLQQENGLFIQKSLLPASDIFKKRWEDLGILLFDADGDGDLDLYTASGGYENEHNTNAYQDKFYINDGKGNFIPDSIAIPQNFTSKFCVRAADYDKDGDLDLFIAGRVDPWNYPKPVSSFIYRNDTKGEQIKFTDVTNIVAKDLINIGLVCDAVFTDYDNDGWQDLILAGEWMPITFLRNNKGIFENVTPSSGTDNQLGWWNTIAPGDFDNDGDLDYIVGNLGENSFYKASDQYPVYITAKDFDNNGSYDAFPSLFLPASQQNKEMREYPAQTRDDIVKQMIGMRVLYKNYRSYATATMDQVINDKQRQGALRLKVNNLRSVYLRNDGNGKFSMSVLPMQAQISLLCGMTVDDFDGDGNLDVVINGNDYGTEVSVGRYDALNGLLLKGDGKGNFTPLTILESGIFIPGNGKALVKIRSKDGGYLLVASQNRGPLKVFELKTNSRMVSLQPQDSYAIINFANGVSQKQEFYYGYSFLSQSGRFLNISKSVKSVHIFDYRGNSRNLPLQ